MFRKCLITLTSDDFPVIPDAGAPPAAMCGGPDWEGNRNLIDAAAAAGVRRFVLVSALGAGESLECIPHASQDVLQPWLAQKLKAEEHLKARAPHGSAA